LTLDGLRTCSHMFLKLLPLCEREPIFVHAFSARNQPSRACTGFLLRGADRKRFIERKERHSMLCPSTAPYLSHLPGREILRETFRNNIRRRAEIPARARPRREFLESHSTFYDLIESGERDLEFQRSRSRDTIADKFPPLACIRFS